MADVPPGNGDFPSVPSHGGQYIQYNIFGNLFEITNKYRPPIMPIGRGAYGIVCSVFNSDLNEMVAMKKIANAFDNHMDAKRTLREIKLLRYLDHENVIAIRDVVPPPLRREFSDVYIAMELMDTDLHQIIRSNQGLSEEHCQYFLYQILRGLKYIHSANVIHRDLKPSNLLLNANCDLKICDFGLARPTAENELLTEYVVTRWYRAPELLLNSSDYTAAIDVWSVGCIFMELMNRKPLFPGKDHVHQMRLLTELLGTPTESDLGFVRNEEARRYIRQLAPHPHQPLGRLFPHVNPQAIDLVDRMLTFDPTRRITVEEALAHPYLERLHDVADEPICGEPFSFDFEQQPLGEEQMKDMIYGEAIALNPEWVCWIFENELPIDFTRLYISFEGLVLSVLTATPDSLRPPSCENGSSMCGTPSEIQFAVLYGRIALASIGLGGIRFAIATRGAGQFDKLEDQGTFFNLFFFAIYTTAIISSTSIVYIEDNVSWGIRKRNSLLSSRSGDYHYHNDGEAKLVPATPKKSHRCDFNFEFQVIPCHSCQLQ